MQVDDTNHMIVDAPESSEVDSASLSRKEASKKTLPWIEKYRPSTLHDLISHEEIIRTRTHIFLFLVYCSIRIRLFGFEAIAAVIEKGLFCELTVSSSSLRASSSLTCRVSLLVLRYRCS